jgi:two-component system nitrogen regulation response regulator NtrX
MAALQACEWPGNVRQLRNIIERTIILAPANRIHMIDADMLPSEIINSYEGAEHNVTSLMGAPLREAREAFEREYLRVQIKRFSGNISKTAAFVGMERSALHRKLKLLGISVRKNGLEFGEDSDA